MDGNMAVQIQHLTKRVGNKTIVDDLSFDIPKGEVFGFLGPNGAGKTTTIRMIVGLISMTNGQVLIHGVDVKQHFSDAMKHIGCIVENPELYKFLTGFQNLQHMARMNSGITNDRINEVVHTLGLQNRIHDKVKTYSLGMRQRLGLAQALLHRPSVLILDEPTNGLDPAGIRELRDHLRKLAKEDGMAIIVSSHLLAEMELMCDRVAVISQGKLVNVQLMSELMSGGESEQVTSFEVNDVSTALAILKNHGHEVNVNASDPKTVDIKIAREHIPAAIESLIQEKVKIFGVRTQSKTLEDKFLEMTGDGIIA